MEKNKEGKILTALVLISFLVGTFFIYMGFKFCFDLVTNESIVRASYNNVYSMESNSKNFILVEIQQDDNPEYEWMENSSGSKSTVIVPIDVVKIKNDLPNNRQPYATSKKQDQYYIDVVIHLPKNKNYQIVR